MSVTTKKLRSLVESQDYRCALSGVDLEPRDASLDHIVPVSCGGSHDMDNVQVVHQVINSCKRTLTSDQFISMCHAVARTHDDPCDPTWQSA